MLVDTDDEDEDGQAGQAGQAGAPGPVEAASEKAAAEKTQQLKAAPKAKSKPPKGASPAKGPVSTAPADGGRKRRKVLKTHINDKGEEETVIEWVEEAEAAPVVDGASAAGASAAGCVASCDKRCVTVDAQGEQGSGEQGPGEQGEKGSGQAVKHYRILWQKVIITV